MELKRFVKCLVNSEPDLKKGLIYEVVTVFPSHELETFDEIELGMSPGCSRIVELSLINDLGECYIHNVNNENGHPNFFKCLGPTTTDNFSSSFQNYIPEKLTVEKDIIYSAITVITNTLEHTKECLAIHDRQLGRTTKKNEWWAKVLEDDIYEAEITLAKLRKLP